MDEELLHAKQYAVIHWMRNDDMLDNELNEELLRPCRYDADFHWMLHIHVYIYVIYWTGTLVAEHCRCGATRYTRMNGLVL